MIVKGQAITQEQQDKATVWACTNPSFTAGSLTSHLLRCRVAPDLAPITAQRFITKWKTSGKILFLKGRWRWQK